VSVPQVAGWVCLKGRVCQCRAACSRVVSCCCPTDTVTHCCCAQGQPWQRSRVQHPASWPWSSSDGAAPGRDSIPTTSDQQAPNSVLYLSGVVLAHPPAMPVVVPVHALLAGPRLIPPQWPCARAVSPCYLPS